MGVFHAYEFCSPQASCICSVIGPMLHFIQDMLEIAYAIDLPAAPVVPCCTGAIHNLQTQAVLHPPCLKR